MDNVNINKLLHCTYALSYHFVFVTKYRRKCLSSEILDALEREMLRLAEKWGGKVLEFNGEVDHVHLLVELSPKAAPSIFANNIKTVTSRLLRRDFSNHFEKFFSKPVLWSRSYFVASTGGAPLQIIKQYIEQQSRPE